MSQTIRNTVLVTLFSALFLGSLFTLAPIVSAQEEGEDTLRLYIQEQLSELRDHITDRRDAYAEYRNAYLATKSTWNAAREEMRDANSDVKACRRDPSPACDQIRLGFVDRQQTFMNATIDRITAHLDNVDTYLIANIGDETEEQVALDWVAEIRTELGDTKTRIDALTTESSKEEILAIRDAVKLSFRETRAVSSAIRGHYLLSTANKAQEKFTALGERFTTEATNLETEGKDVTTLNEAITAYEAQVADIQAHIDQASQLYQDIVTAESVSEEDLKTAAANFKDRAVSAKEHYKVLLEAAKEVFKELHALHNS